MYYLCPGFFPFSIPFKNIAQLRSVGIEAASAFSENAFYGGGAVVFAYA